MRTFTTALVVCLALFACEKTPAEGTDKTAPGAAPSADPAPAVNADPPDPMDDLGDDEDKAAPTDQAGAPDPAEADEGDAPDDDAEE